MNYAVIFAGGTGTRMNSQTCPKQFLKLHGKEIIIYTLEHFQNHPDIDGISLVCVDGWIDHLKKIIKKNDITKAKGVGIIPYTYKDAFNYYYSLWEANQKNENKTIELPVDKVIKILIPERQTKERKLFTFLDEEEV